MEGKDYPHGQVQAMRRGAVQVRTGTTPFRREYSKVRQYDVLPVGEYLCTHGSSESYGFRRALPDENIRKALQPLTYTYKV